MLKVKDIVLEEIKPRKMRAEDGYETIRQQKRENAQYMEKQLIKPIKEEKTN